MTPPRPDRPRRPARRLAALVAAVACLAAACSGGDAAAPEDAPEDAVTADDTEADLADRDDPLPVVTPTPRTMRWLGPDVPVPAQVAVRPSPGVDDATLAAVTEALTAAGATDVAVQDTEAAGDDAEADARPALTVLVGGVDDEPLAEALADARLEVPADLPAEGYALAAYGRSDGTGTIALAGADAAGTFYAAQTLRQLVADGAVAGVGVVDHPAMRHRGSVEGFYGSPWTTEERLDLLAFHGRFKLNTYVYAPKDDPYHRDRWREPYPADRLAELQRLVQAADANHVRFTFAVSPGVSICYSDAGDREALVAKLRALHELGVRSFSIALDDIDPETWHCDADRAAYGGPSTAAAARAQADLLNHVQETFVDTSPGVEPLQMVPTDYRGTGDTPYRQVLREELDPRVEVMWTGRFVVPEEITVDDAGAAAATYGRPVFVWDNTPVNDYPATEGRLVLAPYDRREPGLSAHVTGIVLNPMNQAAASKVQLVGAADFTWNDDAYDPARAQRAAAEHLAGGDQEAVEALLAFFDLENLAPTSLESGAVSQPQAPRLAEHLDAFRSAWASGDRWGAIDGLRPHAERIAAAPEVIRAGVTDPGFLADCGPWLDATALWGQALVTTLDGLAAGVDGDAAAADAAFATAADLAEQASAIRTIPGETRPEGPVRVGDGVLDEFLEEARGLV